ncbi:hypothetical protein IFM61606_01519 [Aspergillus udagawae]|uniref:Uncharacterized protein n=1 Tax=Aspergillus udagawae TaxID=91492 RepID=A0ABQ1AEM7_9EURO|nr:hypothetical protein IFM51744_00934 [Aspergillus udagawae]GFF80294.1 hypothetical protein IFM53868_02821 [Aspergillus udagawae]GFG11197.1 hypothetical protein IFM5058_05306 [Aspergillus udagawae]GFG21665.1 hypothetical protein IFM61606_01519 [Aspergillus udagawae]
MDLSTLEGPPIHNPRLADPACTMSVPQIHLDHAFFTSPETEGFHLLQRPASADAHALPRRTRYLSPACIRHTARPRHGDEAGPAVELNSTVRSSHSPNNRHSHSHVHSYRHSNSDLSSFSPAQRRPRRLTWVESERIWVVTSSPAGSPTSSSTWGDVNWSAAAFRPPPLQHSRSMDVTLAHSQALPQPDDLPPPYERHYFDRPLPPLPPGVEMDPSVGGSAYSQSMSLHSGYSDSDSHSHAGASRWTEIARRMNRTPFG